MARFGKFPIWKKYWIPLLVKLPSFNIPAVTQLSGSVFQLHLSADLFSFAGDLARPWLIRPAHPHRVSHIATHCHTLPTLTECHTALPAPAILKYWHWDTKQMVQCREVPNYPSWSLVLHPSWSHGSEQLDGHVYQKLVNQLPLQKSRIGANHFDDNIVSQPNAL